MILGSFISISVSLLCIFNIVGAIIGFPVFVFPEVCKFVFQVIVSPVFVSPVLFLRYFFFINIATLIRLSSSASVSASVSILLTLHSNNSSLVPCSSIFVTF